MRRIAILLALTGLALGALVAPAAAAPAKSEVVILECGDEVMLDVLVRTDNSGAPLFDASLQSNGRQYVLKFLEGRFYPGELEEEPDEPPLFSFSMTWGNRKGYSQQLTCVTEPFHETDEDGSPLTAFFHVVIAGK